MRRKIDLYIGGRHADLAEQDFILYNYAFTDLQEPAAVKNSFSKQITLPASPANLAIFGHPQRTDRVSTGAGGTGPAFSPGYKTPFELRNELGGIIESGYLRLDSVLMKGRVVSGLKVTLFGGIGGFFYNLSYTTDGEKKTLAHLDYGVTMDSFTITANFLSTAWTRLRSHSQSQGIQEANDVVNFAPAYNGVPDGVFDGKHAVFNPTTPGLPVEVPDGDNTYYTKDGQALLNLKNGHDEWAMKDLRSYLQRPVLSMRAFMQAIANPNNNGGFSVDISQIPADLYVGVWKTLPMISSLGTYGTKSDTVGLNPYPTLQSSLYLGRFYYKEPVPTGADVSLTLYAAPALKLPAGTRILDNPSLQLTSSPFTFYKCIFAQLVAYSGNVKIAGSKVQCICDFTGATIEQLAEFCGYTPPVETEYGTRYSGTSALARRDSLTYAIEGLIPYTIESGAAGEYCIEYSCYQIAVSNGSLYGSPAQDSALALWDADKPGAGSFTAAATGYDTYSAGGQWTSPQEGRTGAVIPYASLLNSAHTPAEYLISFCKINGLIFGYNPASKAVTIMPRNAWFNGQVTDLSGRVDRSQEITIQPLAMKSKWYELKGELVRGAFAEQYAQKYGVDYAIQRVNTGYDFDAAAEELFKGNAFRKAVTLLDKGPYWNRLTQDSHAIPSVFLDPGNTYTLWTEEGEGKDFSVPVPSGDVQVAYYNITYKGYDLNYRPKMEFRDKDGKPQDGVDVLCRYVSAALYTGFNISDDTPAMLAINNGKPCWFIPTAAPTAPYVPIFNAYNTLASSPHKVTRSLDYGIPKEVELPGITFDMDLGSTYLRSWRAYLTDLLDMDTKVMRCRVDLSGLQVGPELLRRFWYYEGSVWVLNKITNYSLTTWDPVECEFVQVRDKANYTNGQNL